jgi:lysyl endopeptidase
MKKGILLVLSGLVGFYSFAQVTDMGGPYAWKPKSDLPATIDTRTMPGYDQEIINQEDAINDATKIGPWRFGYKYDTDYSLSNSGTWTDLPNGSRIWQLGLVCDGAMTINLILEDLFIPQGAYIYLYDVNHTNRVGAYTNRNNNAEHTLGTELVHGDRIVIEYYEPASVRGQGTLTVANVVHGYRSLSAVQDDLMRALESSGNCNVDVNCTLGDGWENEIRSVAMIVVSGNGICTGALINNTCDDGTPYFLTADHCVGGSTANWAFRFNWESPPGTEVCQTVGVSVDPGPPYDQTANGATQLFTSAGSDVALLEIDNMTLTDAQDWNCFFAGWDNTDANTVTQGTGVHHPSGDLKKICRENNPLTQEAWSGAACWRVSNWDNGVTEPGSSGSPLFDQNHRIIGQLYGGGAACSGTNDNGQPDWYGRFGVSWPGLAPYLAPGSCGSATTNDGWDPATPPANDDAGISAIIEPNGNYCTDTFNPVVTLRNYGGNTLNTVTINSNIDGGPNSVFSWIGTLASGGSVDVTLPAVTVTGGAHTFNANTTNPNGVADSNPGNNASSSSFTATVGGQLVTLTIDTDCWGYETAWQILDAGDNVIEEGGNLSVIPGGLQDAGAGDPGSYTNQSTNVESFCLAVGCYDLVVYDDWGDGLSSSTCADGNYELTDASGVLVSMINADFGDSETQNFCIESICTGVIDATTDAETCFEDCDGSITINTTGGTLPYLFDIGGAQQASNTFSSLCSGTYTVTAEDGDGCIQTLSVSVVAASEINTSTVITHESGVDDGAINLTVTGGAGSYSYAWTGPSGFMASSQDISGLEPGFYQVVITDANGCQVILSGLEVEASCNGVVNTTSQDVTCNDDCDGSVTVNVTGGTAPIIYNIGTGAQTSNLFENLCAGNYTIVVTDGDGCITNINTSINEPASLSATTVVTDELNGGDGAIDLTVSGGTGPFTFLWSGPNGFSASTEDISGLSSGNYSVLITDANGCTVTLNTVFVGSSLEIIQNDGLILQVYPNPSSAQFTLDFGANDNVIQLAVSDVTGRIIISHSNISDSVFVLDLTENAAGTYYVTVMSGENKHVARLIKTN